jgi:predicted KAP-like P-loop ATPase
MFLNDHETDVDLLYYEAIARTVVKLIRKTPNSPVTIGVHGDWGAGKSSVLKMTAAALAADENVLCLWFNGWTFEGFEDAKAVVIETIVAELRRARPASTKVADAARKVLKRIDWLKVAKKAGGFAFTAATGIPTFDQIKGLWDVAAAIIGKPQEHISLDDLKTVARQAGECIKDSKDEADHLPDQVHAFRKEFDELLKAADIEQLIVIVDDLDRCLPETAIATLEAIRLFLFVPRTAFVIGADEAMIEYAVREHFPDLPPSSSSASYARNYLEKLIQVPFRIPALGFAETRTYITLLLAENALGSDALSFRKLLDSGREDLRRPWQSRGLDRASMEKAIGGKLSPAIEQAVILSAQITRILTEGTRGNPRQIKRFLNSLMLRHAIAEERGFAAEILWPVLAKLMLAERFSSEFYEQVSRAAVTAPDGKPDAIARFEESVKATPSTAESAQPQTEDKKAASPLPALAEEWAKSDWARAWAAIEPSLKGIDLRPYVFVTRDKRSFLGFVAAGAHLEGLIEKLMGTTLGISGVLPEVRKLTGAEPEQVFDVLRGRIDQAGSYTGKPDGAEGLVALVKEHPALQRRLLGFIRDLPVDKIGTWAPTIWGACFKDPAVLTEFGEIVRAWSEQTGNTVLQKAAQLSGSVRPRGQK